MSVGQTIERVNGTAIVVAFSSGKAAFKKEINYRYHSYRPFPQSYEIDTHFRA